MADADVVIVGAGPAGLAAAAELRRLGVGRVVVLDRAAEAGGVPRTCGHSPYGFREFRRPMLGPAYARALVARATAAGAEVRTGVTVTAAAAGGAACGRPRRRARGRSRGGWCCWRRGCGRRRGRGGLSAGRSPAA